MKLDTEVAYDKSSFQVDFWVTRSKGAFLSLKNWSKVKYLYLLSSSHLGSIPVKCEHDYLKLVNIDCILIMDGISRWKFRVFIHTLINGNTLKYM